MSTIYIIFLSVYGRVFQIINPKKRRCVNEITSFKKVRAYIDIYPYDTFHNKYKANSIELSLNKTTKHIYMCKTQYKIHTLHFI